MRPSRAAVWTLVVGLVTPPLWGQTTAPAGTSAAPAAPGSLADVLTGEARAEYEAARLLYEDGDYAGASLKFQRAYDASKDPRLLWNRAAAEKNLRHYALVKELVEGYLREGGGKISDADRVDAESLIQMVSGFIARLTVTVKQPGATISLDGQVVGKSPLTAPLSVDMGPHEIKVELPGFKTVTRSVNLTGGTMAIDLVLEVEKHEGILRIIVGHDAVIRVDGKMVGIGQWQGTLPSGVHSVEASAKGKQPYVSDSLVQDDQTSTLRVALQDEAPKPAAAGLGIPTWLWVGGAAVLAAGAGVGSYFLFKPDDKAPPPTAGSIGTVELPFLR
jgi:hypothetical protein